MKITALKLKDRSFDNWHAEVQNRWNYKDLKQDGAYCRDWISFDCCLYLPHANRVYCGITSLQGDVFWGYDRATKSFFDCGYGAISEPYDAKFHRSLVHRSKDGCLYAAVALLHDIDKYWDAPGGGIVRYDPVTGKIEKIAIPLPHHYIQSICLDEARDVIYGLTFTPERMFRFHIPTLETVDLGPISSGMSFTQGQNVELDGEGCAWSAWTVTRAWQDLSGPDSHRLCKYDPATARIQFFNTGLPDPNGGEGNVKLDGLAALGPYGLFATGGNGSVYRIDTTTGRVTWLATPIPGRPSRLSSLKRGPDGAAYGVAGMQGNCTVVRFDPAKEHVELLGPLADGDCSCWQIHDVVVTPDGVIYACENDNPYRSSYLWEIQL
ncbi:MAG: hypothetical protein ABFD86_22235 [Bryobacteraceae bacterium]